MHKSSRYRTAPHIACCAAIPRREKHSCHYPTTVLSGSRSEWLLAVPYSENGPQGDAFRNHGGHKIECDGRTPEDYKRSLPPVLPTMAGSMEQVCARARILLRRWLGKCCHMSYHRSAIPQFREHFDCPSYNVIMFSFSFTTVLLRHWWNGSTAPRMTDFGNRGRWVFSLLARSVKSRGQTHCCQLNRKTG